MIGRAIRGTTQRPKTSGRVVGWAINRKGPDGDGFDDIAVTAGPKFIAKIKGGESDSSTNDGTQDIVLYYNAIGSDEGRESSGI